MKTRVLAAVLGVLTSAGVAVAQHQPSRADIDAIVEPKVGQDAPGIAVAVLQKGQVVHMKGYGLADIEAGTPVDEKTIFDLASVSKQMTDFGLMLLIEDDVLTEKTPVADILPAFEGYDTGGRPLIVGDLVHHVSGLPDYASDATAPELKETTTNDEIISWLLTRPLVRAPGTKFEYSNSGYVVLGSLVAAAGGKDSLAAVLQAKIWGPLGMSSTAMSEPSEGVDPKSVAKGYAGTDGHFELSMVPSILEGDGNVMSTLEDLARYEAAMFAHTLLGGDATALLCTNGVMDDGSLLQMEDGTGYGFGWFLSTFGDVDYCWHSGSWFGTATAYVRNRNTGRTVIVLANGEDFDATGLAFEIDEKVE
jgi:CubicO group peptidase (beta-lactamase class C family)